MEGEGGTSKERGAGRGDWGTALKLVVREGEARGLGRGEALGREEIGGGRGVMEGEARGAGRGDAMEAGRLDGVEGVIVGEERGAGRGEAMEAGREVESLGGRAEI